MHDLVKVAVAQARDALAAPLRPSGRRERLAALGSVEEVRQAARRALPRVIFDFVDGGACDEVTLARNVRAFDELSLVPRFLVDVSRVDTSTTVLGRPVDVPVLGAPTGLCGLVHPDAEEGLAAALASHGSVYVLAAMSSSTIEEVRAAAPTARLWFQTYLWRDRGVVDGLLERAAASGYEALVVTVDVPRSSDRRRDRKHRFTVPPRLTPRSVVDGLTHPRWTAGLLGGARVVGGNVADHGGDAVSVASYVDAQFDASASWEDLQDLRARWDGPLVVKGLLHAEDARRAVALGADAVVVSNHGGRQLDQAPASLSALPAVVEAVGGRAEVYLDGGVRRGSDLLKARALGARACLVGRPIVFGLGAGGRAGADRAVQVLAQELEAAMVLAGVRSFDGVGRDLLGTFPPVVGQDVSEVAAARADGRRVLESTHNER
ncbi:L-lactate dehydrogenase LldA [Ornithinimicrobium humiphilum]|uniref:L-lactate dehydrogenase (Cytochrome) n=1 Tax=Ornithinimicrobium humiphilum TaxID=125288 RepID=A0A543KRS0_9MICO|nr:alpha-hydroxy acid oxidase [Ornithinimicrobium humiphilum]TQM97772.1 L-lactate dehydrogenase (cytochrome) [Ornithinimicrobium humiphilum]